MTGKVKQEFRNNLPIEFFFVVAFFTCKLRNYVNSKYIDYQLVGVFESPDTSMGAVFLQSLSIYLD